MDFKTRYPKKHCVKSTSEGRDEISTSHETYDEANKSRSD